MRKREKDGRKDVLILLNNSIEIILQHWKVWTPGLGKNPPISASKKFGFFSPFTAFRPTHWTKGKSKACPFSARDPPPSTRCQIILDPHRGIKSEQQHLSAMAQISTPVRLCSKLHLAGLPADCSQRHNFSTHHPTQTTAGTKIGSGTAT